MRTNTHNNRNTQVRRTKKYRIKSKFRFITSVVIMLGLIITGFNAVTGMDKSLALTKPQYTQVEVSYGDTLWEIANEYKSDNTDTRNAVYEICKANDISAEDLTPGMFISVPQDL